MSFANSSYAWKQTTFPMASENGTTIRGKMVFKTKLASWINTEEPVIIPISIFSVFHEGLVGQVKMKTFISTIKSYVKGKVTILMAEKAHYHVTSLKYQDDYQITYKECLKTAEKIVVQFKTDFEGCHLTFWDSYISKDPAYASFKDQVLNLYQTDPTFQDILLREAESSYTYERAFHFSEKNIFIKKTVEDFLEMSTYCLIASNKGYKFQFYPGKVPQPISYCITCLSLKPMTLVEVNLGFERKTIIQHSR